MPVSFAAPIRCGTTSTPCRSGCPSTHKPIGNSCWRAPDVGARGAHDGTGDLGSGVSRLNAWFRSLLYGPPIRLQPKVPSAVRTAIKTRASWEGASARISAPPRVAACTVNPRTSWATAAGAGPQLYSRPANCTFEGTSFGHKVQSDVFSWSIHKRTPTRSPASTTAPASTRSAHRDPRLTVQTIHASRRPVNSFRGPAAADARPGDTQPSPTALPKRLKPTKATISSRAWAMTRGMTRRVRVYSQAKTTPITALPMNGPKPW